MSDRQKVISDEYDKQIEGWRKGHNHFMRAYYYSFSNTGNPAIDSILEMVAISGKRFHNTSDWGDGRYSDANVSCEELIQEAARRAAKELKGIDND